jgi:hypothetical protein
MVGQAGTIVYREEDSLGEYRKYLIQLDPVTDSQHLAYCHDGDGRTPDRDGYWAFEEELTLSDPNTVSVSGLRVGDRVRMVDGHEAPFDLVGTVVILTGDEYDIGVRFDNFNRGHDLGQNNGAHDGWWCYSAQLRRVA